MTGIRPFSRVDPIAVRPIAVGPGRSTPMVRRLELANRSVPAPFRGPASAGCIFRRLRRSCMHKVAEPILVVGLPAPLPSSGRPPRSCLPCKFHRLSLSVGPMWASPACSIGWLDADLAIVDDTAGVTRDRMTYLMESADRYFELVDTGGMGIEDTDNLTRQIEEQISHGHRFGGRDPVRGRYAGRSRSAGSGSGQAVCVTWTIRSSAWPTRPIRRIWSRKRRNFIAWAVAS